MDDRLSDSGDWEKFSKKDNRALGRRQKGTNKTLRYQPASGLKAGVFAEYSAPTLGEDGLSMVPRLFNRQRQKPGDGQLLSLNKNRGWETLEKMKSDPDVRVIETSKMDLYAGRVRNAPEGMPLVQDLVHNISLDDDGVSGVYLIRAEKERENIKVRTRFDRAAFGRL